MESISYTPNDIKDRVKMVTPALQYLLETIHSSTSQAELHYHLGKICESFQSPDLAHEAFSKVISLDPHHVGALSELAAIYSTKGNQAEAIRTYKKILRFDPGNSEAYFMIGFIYQFNLKDPGKAIRFFEQAVRLDPSHDLPLLFLGRAFLQLDDIESASKTYNKLKLVDSRLAETLLKLINKKSAKSTIKGGKHHAA